MALLYKGNKLVSQIDVKRVTNVEAINGVNFASSELTIDNETLGAQGIIISGQLEQTEINITEYVEGTKLIVNSQEIDVNNINESINGVTWADSELYIDQNLLKANEIAIENTDTSADVYVKGDSTNVYVELLDGTVDISNCTSEIFIEDNQTAEHTVSATNLSAANIKKDVTILGVTGTYTDAIDGVTYDEDTMKLTINKNAYIYIGNSSEVYIGASVRLKMNGGSANAENLSAENIKKGVTILGVTGTYEGE